MKAFAIIIDEDNKKRVVPSKWLSDDLKSVYWPSDEKCDLKKSIINLEEPGKDWDTFVIRKFIKSNDNYTDAVKDMNMQNIEEVSDASDIEKMKKSRSKRCKKIENNSISGESRAKKSKVVDDSESNDSEINDNTSSPKVSGRESSSTFPIPATSLIVTIKDTAVLANKEAHSDYPTSTETTSADEIVEESTAITEDMTMKELLIQNLDTKKVLKSVHSIAIKQEILQKQILINNQRKANTVATLSDEGLKNVLNYFPINGNEADEKRKMDVIEEKLLEKKFLANTVQYMKTIGGSNPHDSVQKIMTALINDEVLSNYSYHGQKKNAQGEKNKKFGDLMLCRCIFDVINKTFTGVKTDDTKKSIASWLDSAKTRVNRKMTNPTRRTSIAPPPLLELTLDEPEE